jgi:peptidoglycan/LPS O-acetylase OafA/YrhL
MEILFAPLRFSVAVFFTISFFLLSRSLNKNTDESVYSTIKKRLVRLAIPTVVWFSLATGLRFVGKAAQNKPLFITVLQGSVFPGAYYLLVMLQLIIIFAWVHNWFSKTKNVLITIFLQVLAFGFMYTLILGVWGPDVLVILKNIARSFIAYWFVYMALGAYFYTNWTKLLKISASISQKKKVILLFGTALLMMIEYSCLYLATKGQTLPFEYAMVSCVFSVPVIFVCLVSLQEDQLAKPIRTTVQLLSKYSLGIFCINGILSLIFSYFGSQIFVGSILNFPQILLLKLVSWTLLLTISVYLSILLDRVGLGACVR